MKKITIIGAGQVGTLLAEDLSQQQHDIVLIERDREKIKLIKDGLDIMCVEGDASEPQVLEEADIGKSDVVLAVSGDDKTNIMCAISANLMGVPGAVAKVRNPEYISYASMLRRQGISIINPGEIISKNIVNTVKESHFAWSDSKIGNGKIDLFKLRVGEDSKMLNTPLSELRVSPWIFVGVAREGGMLIPSGETALLPGDSVYALGDSERLGNLTDAMGLDEEDESTHIVIIGAGRLGKLTASLLHKSGATVKVIESDPLRASEIAEEVPGIIVLSGDATDVKIQKEAGVEAADYLIALTGDDGENILSALLARRLGAKRSIVLYTKPDYVDVLETIGIDISVSVRISVVNEILSMLDLGVSMRTTLLEEGRGEILEFVVGEESEILGKPLKNANLPEGCIVGVCIRNNETIIPQGSFTPQINDTIIVFTLPEAVKKVEKAIL
ncbi:MAG: Trk system potassium transporter TrkA [Thermodesulfobacteriota bacterium]